MRSLAQSFPSPIEFDNFLRSCWLVVPDPDSCEYVRAPRYQAEFFYSEGRLEGDCDDAATLTASVLYCLGWPAMVRAIRMPAESDFSHVFCCSVQDGLLIEIDPIVPVEHMPITGVAEVMSMLV